MPVSKKRKKDGKPVHRNAPAKEAPANAAPAAEGVEGIAPVVVEAPRKFGKPSNPFVASPQGRRASQRGR
ncbi:MAG: hypothetical protein WCK73_02860 [Deltaproteobacteria bacterium]